MASGDVVLETTTGFNVIESVAGTINGAEGWAWQLFGSSGASDTPPSATISLDGGEPSWPAGLVIAGPTGASPLNPAKKYDIKITEH